MPKTTDDQAVQKLLEIMASLRHPESGCPWDLKQDFSSILPYTIEEVYEVADTIEQGDFASLRDELGDLLFQIVFYAQLGKEQGLFGFTDIVDSISDKLVRRHPHVFGSADVTDPGEVNANWEALKSQEREEKAQKQQRTSSILDDIPAALPALIRARKIQQRVSRVGFDWDNVEGVLAKLEEEIQEVRECLPGSAESGMESGPETGAATGVESGQDRAEHLEEELGDLMFACVNLVRFTGLDPESVMRRANTKFETRFRAVESELKQQGKLLAETGLDELEQIWQQLKTTR